MWRRLLIATCVLCLSASLACAAGLQRIEVPAGGGGAAIAGAVWYPCARPVTEVALARLHVTASPDCPVTGNGLPLVVISHGYGGNLAGHHDTAETLADAGFVVVAINHPVDSTDEMSRADTLAWFTERPVDIRRTIDFMLDTWPDHGRIDPGRIGFFGFSRGGYTGLVAIGAEPDFQARFPRSVRRRTAAGTAGRRGPASTCRAGSRMIRASGRRSSWTPRCRRCSRARRCGT